MKGNQSSESEKTNPAAAANFLSRIFFCWINALVKKGYRKNLDLEDLYPVTDENSSERLAQKLQQKWTAELERWLSIGMSGKPPSFWLTLLRCFKLQLATLAIFTFGEEATRVAQPLLLANMLDYFTHNAELQASIENAEAAAYGNHTTALEAYLYALGLTLTSAFTVLMHHPRYFYSFLMGMRMRLASCSLIFRKALKLPSVDTGQVVNLMSADVSRLDYGFMFIHYIWVAPLLAAVVLAITWTHLGLASLPGFGLVILMAPLQRVQGRLNARLRYKAAKETDCRIQLMSQIITGIKVIKMYCWEKPFADHVASARRKEMGFVGMDSKVKLILMELGSFIFSKLATVACVLTFVLLYGHMPPLATVLIVMRLLGTVQDSVAFNMTYAVSFWGETRTTCKRIQEFLMKNEIEVIVHRDQCCLQDTIVELRSFSGRWHRGPAAEPACVDHISIHVTAGELLAIVGVVGSGKTSVLMALLGELRCTSGERLVKGRIAYAAQEAWIFPASLRENVLFGSSFCVEKYVAVLEACDLTSDVASLPHGDQTLVGERGVKLSGGQRARIGLARAVYSGAEIYLLDDPLSAVDTQVAKHIFDRCINGLLKDKCRVLVTHQCHLVKLANNILVVDGGTVTASGTYSELVESGVNFARLLDRSGKHATHIEAGCAAGDSNPAAQSTSADGRTAEACVAFCNNNDDQEQYMPASVGDEPEDEEANVTGAIEANENTHAISTVRKDTAMSTTINLAAAEIATTSAADEMAAVHEAVFGDGAAVSDGVMPADGAAAAHGAAEAPLASDMTVKHVEPEGVEQGAVAAGAYWTYFHSGANAFCLAALALLMAFGQACFMATDWYISHWAAVEDAKNNMLRTNDTHHPRSFDNNSAALPTGTNSIDVAATENGISISSTFGPVFSTFQQELNTTVSAINTAALSELLPSTEAERIYVYVGLVAALICASCLRALSFNQVCMRASKKIHDHIFTSVVSTRMRFFDTQPLGRIINRFSKDIDVLDSQLPLKYFEFLSFFLLIIGTVVLASYSNPWVLLPLAPVIVALILVQRFYVRSSRALKRLEAITRSPMMSHLNSILTGLHTVRAYGVEVDVTSKFDCHQDRHTEAFYLSLCVGRWLGIRLDWMCVVFVASVTFLCIVAKDSLGLGADLFGLTVTYTVALMGLFQWAVRLSIDVESLMTSVERLVEYTHLPGEVSDSSAASPPREPKVMTSSSGKSPPSGWPTAGRIEAENLCLKFAPNEPEVLRSITFDIRGSEKIGVCGRTGSGKSTLLTVALFRLTEPTGRLAIDGVQVADLDMHELRSKISIIPQDPVLFQTTVRRNLDPFGECADSVLWDALGQVQLATFVHELPGGLDSALAENGANFSIGQRQLLCLARAVIHRNRILVVDEATANVDLQTDAAIQKTIREQFRDCTVLTIAHRLDTIADSDRVMVLDGGCLHEFDSPFILLQRHDSLFRSLAGHTGVGFETVFAIAKAAHDRRAADSQP